MAELKIIGVKRVEALLAVLDQKEKDAISALVIPSMAEIKAQVDAEFGLTELRAKEDALLGQLNETLIALNEATGSSRTITTSESYRNSRRTDYGSRVDALERELRQSPIDDVKAAFKAKRTQLWLCETLEDAKAVVGLA
jgi:hypothetical protein